MNDKVSLASFKANIEALPCINHCLANVDAVILSSRWRERGSKGYNQKSSWILENLRNFDVVDASNGIDVFYTIIVVHHMYYRYHTTTLGYSKQ